MQTTKAYQLSFNATSKVLNTVQQGNIAARSFVAGIKDAIMQRKEQKPVLLITKK